MYAAFRHTARVVTVLSDVEATWASPLSGEVGTARFTVPATDAAYSPTAIDASGGSLVVLTDHGGGVWAGILDTPTATETGLDCSAWHLAKLLGQAVLRTPRTFTNLTAGAIARQAVRDALGGLSRAPFRLGSFAEAAPIVPHYRFEGQTLDTVLADLAGLSGAEWQLEDNGVLSWGGQTGRLLTTPLVSGNNVVDVRRESRPSERADEVIARNPEGREARAKLAANGRLFSSQRVVSSEGFSPVRLGLEANAALVRQAETPTVVSFAVRRELVGRTYGVASVGGGATYTGWGDRWGSVWGGGWSGGGGPVGDGAGTLLDLANGDTVVLYAPELGLDGERIIGRVVSRTVSEQSEWVTVRVVTTPAMVRAPQLIGGRWAAPRTPRRMTLTRLLEETSVLLAAAARTLHDTTTEAERQAAASGDTESRRQRYARLRRRRGW